MMKNKFPSMPLDTVENNEANGTYFYNWTHNKGLVEDNVVVKQDSSPLLAEK